MSSFCRKSWSLQETNNHYHHHPGLLHTLVLLLHARAPWSLCLPSPEDEGASPLFTFSFLFFWLACHTWLFCTRRAATSTATCRTDTHTRAQTQAHCVSLPFPLPFFVFLAHRDPGRFPPSLTPRTKNRKVKCHSHTHTHSHPPTTHTHNTHTHRYTTTTTHTHNHA